LIATLSAGSARAKDVAVPVTLQVELLAKVLAHDRNLPSRAQGQVRVRIVANAADADSGRIANQLRNAVATRPTIADLPVEVSTADWSTAAKLVEDCRRDRISVLFLSTGIAPVEVTQLAAALAGADLFTATADPAVVQDGALLGFDLVSGKPKLVFHLSQARRQNVAVAAGVLQLMKVIE
jgi:hypothetical protein